MAKCLGRRAAVAAGLVAAVLGGCGKRGLPEQAADPAVPLAAAPTTGPVRYDISFDEAITHIAPEGSERPPDTTLTGKSTAKLHAAVREAWPSVKLTDAAGKPVPIVVAFDTDAGPVELTLFPELAPNHVRNLLALVAVGYYDGLVFERVIRQEVVAEGGSKQRVELLTAGCPAGDGEPARGHLGYFLKPEPSTLRHEEGTVGFVRDEDACSACCRFYVCTAAAPVMDDHFTTVGKVTRGMDVVKRIAARPVKDPNTFPASEQPQDPVRIRKAERK